MSDKLGPIHPGAILRSDSAGVHSGLEAASRKNGRR